jgi:predicted S18 family serine protease
MDRERVLQVLRDELQAARKRLNDASDYLDSAIQINRRPGPTKSTEERVRYAARSYRDAIANLASAEARLKEFEVHGLIPDDLQVRRSPQQPAALARPQRVA